MSLPTRGAWIEMLTMEQVNKLDKVAPYAGSVD